MLHDFLADREAETCALLVGTGIFVKFAKIYKKLFEALWVDSHASVDHTDAEIDVPLLLVFDTLGQYFLQMDLILALLLWVRFALLQTNLLYGFLLFKIELLT